MVTLKYREKELIRRLLVKGEMTGSSLALKLDVSSRTIRNDIQTINELIKKKGLAIVGSTDGYSLKGDMHDFKELLNDFNTNDFGDPINRENYLTHLLLLNNDCSFFDLVDQLHVSESTLRNDVRRINQHFENLGESFTIQVSKNKISISHESEERIRMAFTALVHYIYRANFITLSFWENQKVYVEDIRQVLIDFLKDQESYLQQNDFIYLLNYLTITIFRKSFQGQLKNSDDVVGYEPLFAKLEKVGYKLSITEKSLVSNLISSLNQLQIEEVSKNYNSRINQLLSKIDNLFMTEFTEDNQLIESLNCHLESILKKQSVMLPTPDEFVENIEHLYPFSYSVAQYFSQELQKIDEFKHLGYKETETILFTIYFELSLERAKTTTDVRAILVSDRGRAATSLLQTQLRSRLPNLQILMTLPPSAVNQVEFYSADLILSTTESIKFPDEIKSIILSIPLSNEDLNDISQFIDSSYFWKKTVYDRVIEVGDNVNSQSQLLDLLEESVSNIEGKKVELAIPLSEREKLRTTYIGRGLAMPHGLIKEDLKYNVYVLRSQKGIEWGSKTVNVLVCILITESSRKNMNNYMKLVNGLYEKLEDESFDYDSTEEIIDEIDWSHNEI